jgi:3-dehydroquinate synthase
MTAAADTVTTIRVGRDREAYDVAIGRELASRVPAALPGARTVAVVRPPALAEFADAVVTALTADSRRVIVADLPAGEEAKSVASLTALWQSFGAAPLTRSDAIVAVGGGATTDVVGFAAATWLRGVRVVHVPTTLLGMVDAAIGGKTAINTESGKNLVGAFHPPAGVVVDLAVLDTLPDAQWVNGMAEVVKAGFIADPRILDLVEADTAGAGRPTGPHTRELVERAIRVKATVVTDDLRESGAREFLNYGHTLAHAIELVERFRWPHGHAVSVGLVFAAALAQRAGRLDADVAVRHRAVLEALGLPTRYAAGAWPALLDAMRVDKKARGDQLRFVVLDALASPAILTAPEPELLAAAYSEVAQ